MAKLNITLNCKNLENAIKLLESIAMNCFHAHRITENFGSAESYNIDNGMNDIRAVIDEGQIQFFCRYKNERMLYEKKITDFLAARRLSEIIKVTQ